MELTKFSAMFSFNRCRGSRISRTVMGVRVEVTDGESVTDALRRLKRGILHERVTYELYWHSFYISPGQHRRAAKGRAKRKAKILGWMRQRGR